jgi:hypothetical protein
MVAPRTENENFEAWIAILEKLAEEHERADRAARAVEVAHASHEIKNPMPKLAEGPWRSLGGYFDYTHWSDRERFLELDRAIAASQDAPESDIERGPSLL